MSGRKTEAIQIALELLKPTPSATQLNDARNVLAGALVGGPAGESLRSQCDRLARFIIENCAGYPQGDEGAMDAAIRIIRDQKNESFKRLSESQQAFETEVTTVRQVLGEEISRITKERDDLQEAVSTCMATLNHLHAAIVVPQCSATTEILYSGVGTASAHCLKPSGHKGTPHSSKGGVEWNDAATVAQPPPVTATQEHAAVGHAPQTRCINCNLTRAEHGKGTSRCDRFTEYPKPCPYAHPIWRWVVIVEFITKRTEHVFAAPSAEDALTMARLARVTDHPFTGYVQTPGVIVEIRCAGKAQ